MFRVQVIITAMDEVLLIGTAEVREAVRGQLDDPRGQTRYEPAVMGHEDQGAVIGLQPIGQRRDALQIQVVSGLIEQQHVGLGDVQPREDEPRGLAARQRRDLLVRVLPGEEHTGQAAEAEADGLRRAEIPQPVEHRGTASREELPVVLGEVALMGLVAPLALTDIGFELAHHDLEQGGLADAVGPDDGQAIPAVDLHGHVHEHVLVTVGFAQAVDAHHRLAAVPLLLEDELRIPP